MVFKKNGKECKENSSLAHVEFKFRVSRDIISTFVYALKQKETM